MTMSMESSLLRSESVVSAAPLFGAHRDDGIDARRAARRDQRRAERDCREEERHERERWDVVRANSVEERLENPHREHRGDETDRDAADDEPAALREHEPHHVAACRTERHTYSQFARALGDGVRDHAVKPCTCEHQRECGKDRQHGPLQPPTPDGARDDLVEGLHLRHGEVRIEPPYGGTKGWYESMRIVTRRANDDRLLPRGILRVRVIDGRTHWLGQAIMAEVPNHTDHGRIPVAVTANAYSLAHRIVPAERRRDHLLIYEHHRVEGVPIRIYEPPPVHEPDADRLEVVGRHVLIVPE